MGSGFEARGIYGNQRRGLFREDLHGKWKQDVFFQREGKQER
jgi:hypothetical protein